LALSLLPEDRQGKNAVEEWLANYRKDWQKLPLLSQISAAEADNYMQHILLRDTDQMSMAHALEVRVPFLDHELVSYVLSIPDALKYPSYPKKLLVESLGDLLPSEVVHRKKMGFTFPWEIWLRNDLAQFCAQSIEQVEDAGLFIPGSARALLQRFNRGDKTVIWAHIWLLAILGNWMHRNNVQA
jgi:asparagine synthase (glutamine-hydrolysing)